jgi:hypothetical protein
MCLHVGSRADFAADRGVPRDAPRGVTRKYKFLFDFSKELC